MTDADDAAASGRAGLPEQPIRLHGVDFSGGRSAGKRTWISSGTMENDQLKIETCQTASSMPGSTTHREGFLESLRGWIREQGPCAIGLTFPFSLPEAAIEEDDWEAFVRGFPKRFEDEDRFRMACQRVSPGRELKRETDKVNSTPFSPYNLRMYKQTYHGIAGILAPLIEDDAVRVLPMQEPDPDKPLLLEVCPASTMTAQGQKTTYKGSTQEHRAARTRILKDMQSSGKLTIRAQGVLSSVLRDSGGDALDSVIAAHATTRAFLDEARLFPAELDGPAIEGHVYV